MGMCATGCVTGEGAERRVVGTKVRGALQISSWLPTQGANRRETGVLWEEQRGLGPGSSWISGIEEGLWTWLLSPAPLHSVGHAMGVGVYSDQRHLLPQAQQGAAAWGTSCCPFDTFSHFACSVLLSHPLLVLFAAINPTNFPALLAEPPVLGFALTVILVATDCEGTKRGTEVWGSAWCCCCHSSASKMESSQVTCGAEEMG